MNAVMKLYLPLRDQKIKKMYLKIDFYREK